ncbi:hypothetical protein SAMN05428959_1145 [Duganella sp. CF517]|uniref:DUF6708 domain-containing protein n=1 Tax=Duganella sp. CF517 TaxID=1881038 RepID=UPI0008D56F19|nr:DUF6708 domain-containing protein [Duganella sp. CF517]SEO63429.1 hypothetical protein SAMN05428959_1145 [Duganella sp. CF517]
MKESIFGIIEVYKKNVPAAPAAISFNLIKNEFAEAIEYKGIIEGNRGVVAFFGFLIFIVFAFAMAHLISYERQRKYPSLFDLSMTVFFVTVFSTFAVYFFLKCIRMELFRPEDEPIIFDRKNRKVYRIFREIEPGWRRLLKKWPVKATIHDWNLIDAEHHATVNADGSTISRIHTLIFLVRKSRTDSTIVDSFTLGNGMLHGEVTVSAVYEHVRKFMEENGPHVPTGDVLSDYKKPATFLECMARTGPYGETLKQWWRNAKYLTILGFIFFLITFPIATFVGLFSWLSYSTATPIEWSSEIRAAVGPPAPKL